jgi:hypothetical protein
MNLNLVGKLRKHMQLKNNSSVKLSETVGDSRRIKIAVIFQEGKGHCKSEWL